MDVGGGAEGLETRATLHLNCGDIVFFDADLYHQGLPITRGLRYLLVGFCYTDTAGVEDLRPGHMNLQLKVPTLVRVENEKSIAERNRKKVKR